MASDLTPEEIRKVHEERRQQQLDSNRRERKEDMKAAFHECLDDLLKDMRPARSWPEIRGCLETALSDQETRSGRGKFLKNAVFEHVATMLIHIILSAGVFGTVLHFLLAKGNLPQ